MGKAVEEKKQKKKGRPSLLDLQKRTLKEEQQLQQKQQNRANNDSDTSFNPNYASATPVRRSARRNPNLGSVSPEKVLADEESPGKRREKKLKFVLRLPHQKSSLNSASLNSYGSDSNADDDNAASNSKKPKINAIGDGMGHVDSGQDGKSISGPNLPKIPQGADPDTQLDSGTSTPLPAKKLLLFILDRLQKKDTYGVYSEPVDPEELPDYFDIIEHPMDFGTVRNKLGSGAYASLEQLEKDVFLICSNAMQYNAPDTIYFRQARSIQELAKKNFENLRQDSENDDPKPRIVRRGRPPKHLKKQLDPPTLGHTLPQFSLRTHQVTSAENTNITKYDLRKGHQNMDKSVLAGSSRSHPISQFNGAHTTWLAGNRFPTGDDTGVLLKGNSLKQGKKQIVFDENRRNTYNPSTRGQGPSFLNTFDEARKLLMPVGIHSEHGYSRSLARFAANLGPVSWKIASKKIERALPAGVKFGPGWVGENDVTMHGPPLFSSAPGQLSVLLPFIACEDSHSASTPDNLKADGVKVSENPEGNKSSKKLVPNSYSALGDNTSTPSPSLCAVDHYHEPCTKDAESTIGVNSSTGFNNMKSCVIDIPPRLAPEVHPGPIMRPGRNGYNGAYGSSLSTDVLKVVGVARPAECSFRSSQVLDATSKSNGNFIYPLARDKLISECTNCVGNLPTADACSLLPKLRNETMGPPLWGLNAQASWQSSSPLAKASAALMLQHKPDLVPPDLNVGFQSPGSPSSSRNNSGNHDLALQL